MIAFFLSIKHTNNRATMPPDRKRQVSAEEANERRRKIRQRRKRKFGAIKKIHDLKKDCGFEAALFLFHPETGQIFTYIQQTIKFATPGLRIYVENLLNKPSCGDDLRDGKTSDEEENAPDDARPDKHTSIQLHEMPGIDEDLTAMRAVPSTSEPSVEISTRRIPSPRAEFACDQRELLPIMSMERRASPRTLYPASVEALMLNFETTRPSIEAGTDAAPPCNGTNVTDANILTPHNICDQAQVPQDGLDSEICRLKKEHDRIRNWKNRLLQLQRLDEEEDKIKRTL
ncbi:hypothetical protein BU23DRAFT_604820 [Bimuria novae-zelandiae CBS 107.79]|uniref:Uncharacterized protein n=1 Tax=Bimuria novae-zelandiae CBS 107.79 TaxID=1447943 RepID=A0A6A5UKA1_9PLEO|nr:hypothetical protein BU23DRAFT_604820 [Bimuria novae-zelandiae CBS 107.79]